MLPEEGDVFTTTAASQDGTDTGQPPCEIVGGHDVDVGRFGLGDGQRGGVAG